MERSYHNLAAHRKNAQYHFLLRCRQRFGLILSLDDYQKILLAIKYGQRIGKITSCFIRDLDNNTKFFEVTYEEKTIFVIYNVELQELVTALTDNPKEIQRYATGTSIF